MRNPFETPERAAFRDTIRRFVDTELRPHADEWDEAGVVPWEIADMSAKIDAVEAYMNQICWLINEGEMPVAELCKAKFLATKTMEFCASEAMQIFGGAGYLRGNAVERAWREVKVMAIGGGSEEIMRDLAVRQMGL